MDRKQTGPFMCNLCSTHEIVSLVHTSHEISVQQLEFVTIESAGALTDVLLNIPRVKSRVV